MLSSTMVAASKLLRPEIAELECYHILHPFTRSCLRALISMYLNSIFGSAGFFAVFYLFQCLTRAFKKKKQSVLRDLLRTYIRSTLFFSSIVSTSFIGFSCLFRKILGRFYYYSMVFIPATLAGWGIANETPKNRDFFSTSFANMALETIFIEMKASGTLKWSPAQQTLIFMFLTSIVSYLYNLTDNENKYFWFFVPPKVMKGMDSPNKCFHEEACFKNIMKNFAKNFSTGFILKFLKLLFSQIHRPKVLISALIKPKTYSFAAFLGFYAFTFQAFRCLLYQKNRSFSPVQDLLSGFLSGITFQFEPNIAIFNSAAITIFQILIEIGLRKKILPNLPYNELVFAVSCGLLFHSKCFSPSFCSPLMQNIMSSITYKGADYISDNYQKLAKSL